MNKPRINPLLFLGLGVILLVVVLAGRLSGPQNGKSGDGSGKTEEVEESTGRQSAAARTAVRKVTVSHDEHASRNAAASRSAKPMSSFAEDFDTQKLRVAGDDELWGFVFGEGFKPVAGAQVALYEDDPMTKNPPLREAVTDEKGSFTLENVTDKDLRFILVARAENYAPEARFVTLDGSPTASVLRLHHGVPFGGEVRDASTSQPLADATVYFPAEDDTVFGLLGTVQTAQDGRFAFPFARAGGIKVLAELNGYNPALESFRSPRADAIVPMIAGAATVRGVTIARVDQRPQGGAKVVLATENVKRTLTSDEEGEFEFTNVAAATYELYAIKGMASEKQEVEVAERVTVDDLKVILPSPLFVSGKVIHAINNNALPGVRVNYSSPVGASSVLTDENGQFGFETMALRNYAMWIHERGFLPITDKRTTGVVETIKKKIAITDASDEVLIRLRPVPSVHGKVRRQGQSKNTPVVAGAQVTVAYQQGDVSETLKTRSDSAGNFFVNLPTGKTAIAKVVAELRSLIDSTETRVPQKRALELLLRPVLARGQLLLVDKSPLSGVRIGVNYLLPSRGNLERSTRIPIEAVYTNPYGVFGIPVAPKENVELTFSLPDGKQIAKVFDSDQLSSKRRYFIYDPVLPDVLSDAERSKPTKAQATPAPSGGSQQSRNREQRPRVRTQATPAPTPNSR